MKLLRFAFSFAFVLFACSNLSAHEIRPGFLQIEQIDDNSYTVYWKIPRLGDAIPKISIQFPQGFKAEELNRPNPTPGFVLYAYTMSSTVPLNGSTIGIDGLDKTLIDVLVNVNFLNGEKVSFILQPDNPFAEIPEKETIVNTIKTYLVLGVEHILLGIDHLLFVLALLLITPGFKNLLKTITAFTIAHSITLSLAALGYVNFPSAPVEAVIALSIVFLAVELVNNLNGRQTLTSRKPWIVAFSFGLLHGFGFAGALAAIGLPQQDIPLALAFFNVGVEIGQLIFVVAVLGTIKLLSIYKKWPAYSKKIPAYAIGSIATFWMIQRVIAFWD